MAKFVRTVGGEGDGFGGPEAGELVMAVAGVDAAKMVDDDVGAEGTDDADHVFEDLVAPDFLRLFRRFRISKIRRTREVELDPIAPRGSEQFLGADQPELRCLLRAEGI